jgi:hypothetical protein
LQGAGKGFDFAPIAENARRQFQTKTVPSIAERFTSLGDSAQRSSAFSGALGQQGAELESNLGELGAKFGLLGAENQRQLLGMLLSAGLAPQFSHQYQAGSQGLVQNLLGNAAGGGGSWLTGIVGDLAKSIYNKVRG